MKNWATIAAATAALLFEIASASAHADLRQATPAAGSNVSAASAEVVLNFSEPLEASFSSIIVRDAVGKRVDKTDAHLDSKDPTTIRVSLPPLDPGSYIVVWRTLTTDTHRTDGAFIFRVGQ
jgi:methionine-rich copper-binding protein CopC